MTQNYLSLIKAAIIDMDGVLWRADQPLGNLEYIFNQIENLGWSLTLATNNSTNTVNQYLEKLLSYGVHLESYQIITSALAAASYLKRRYPNGGKVFVVGEPSLSKTLGEKGFVHDDNEAIAVIAGMDRTLTFDKLAKATIRIREGAEFIATNADRTFPMPYGLVPGAGAIIAALETASDISPVVVGKPSSFMYQVAMERMSCSPSQTIVIGDRLETDIAGGQELNCHTALVLSGVTSEETAKDWNPPPDLITSDLTQLLELFAEHR